MLGEVPNLARACFADRALLLRNLVGNEEGRHATFAMQTLNRLKP